MSNCPFLLCVNNSLYSIQYQLVCQLFLHKHTTSIKKTYKVLKLNPKKRITLQLTHHDEITEFLQWRIEFVRVPTIPFIDFSFQVLYGINTSNNTSSQKIRLELTNHNEPTKPQESRCRAHDSPNNPFHRFHFIHFGQLRIWGFPSQSSTHSRIALVKTYSIFFFSNLILPKDSYHSNK